MKHHGQIFLYAVLITFPLFGTISFSKEKVKDISPAKKAAEDVQKALSAGSLKNVDTRLRVEGASFRKFNLYLPKTMEINANKPSERKTFQEIRKIIERDLAITGAFNVMASDAIFEKTGVDGLLIQKGAEGISKLSLTIDDDLIKASLEHKSFVIKKPSQVKNFEAKTPQLRRLSHLLAQSIYEEFVGSENLFLLQIAAVRRDKSGDNFVVLLDFDGQNETLLTDGKWMKTTVTFAPDGKSILYAVSPPEGQKIVEQAIWSKQIKDRIGMPGLTYQPRVFPDNSGLLVTLSFQNNANIYRTSRAGKIIGPVTSSLGLNLSPAISPNGKEIAFVSDRSGTPQIYVQSFAADAKSNVANRVTFKGSYNQTPQFSPDGKLIAFTGRDEEYALDIFLLERGEKPGDERVSRITHNQGRNEGPAFSPSGRFLIFEREQGAKRDMVLSSLNGDHQFVLTDVKSMPKTLGYFSLAIKPTP
jgi:TolB protein